MTDYTALRWRVGRKVGRTVYAQLGDGPTLADPMIGVMDTPELAAEAVRSHNNNLQIQAVWTAQAAEIKRDLYEALSVIKDGEPGD